MNRDDDSLNLSSLIALLETTLLATNQTKTIVSNTCTSAGNLLKNWRLPAKESTTTTQCTCDCELSYKTNDNIQELAEGIENVVENAQKLRESAYPKRFNQPTVELKTDGVNSKNVKSHLQSKPTGPANGLSPRPSATKLPSHSLVKVSPPVRKSKNSSLAAQSTYQKDFTPRSKSRLLSKASSTILLASAKASQSEKQKNKPITMAQLDELMSRVAVGATLYSSGESRSSTMSSEKPSHNNCAVHGTNVTLHNNLSIVEQKVELAEAIDELGVPSDLVKVLKVYQRFLDKHLSEEIPKPSKSANKFVEQVSILNQQSWKEAMNEPVASLLAEYRPLYEEIADSETLDCTEKAVLSDKFQMLELKYRKCGNHDSSWLPDALPSRRSSAHGKAKEVEIKRADAWLWNAKSASSFQGMGETLCIRYRGEEQLRNFLDNIQHIQQMQFQSELLEILVGEILPKLKEMDAHKSVICLGIKTMIALCDVSNLKMPTIIKNPSFTC